MRAVNSALLFCIGDKPMTWLELKNIIKTLGFEENSVLTEYQEIIINACNLSVSTINDIVVVDCFSLVIVKPYVICG